MTSIPFSALLPSLLINVLVFLVWFGPMGVALLRLRHATLPEAVRLIWALTIVMIPVIGPVAFLLIVPNRKLLK